MIKTTFRFLGDFFNLFYPRVCAACGNNLVRQETLVCMKCLYDLPKTHYSLQKDNPVCRLFWGRTPIENATSYYFYNKGTKFQKLIHNLKYKGQKEIGYELGKYLGAELKSSPLYASVDVLVPVPLHPKREKERGYNQSDWIVKGMAECMNIPISKGNLYRKVATKTQTKKSRIERWDNVENIFALKNPELFINKHILLVDDVITTGSTFEACANTLLTAENVKVSIAAVASAT